MLLHTGSFSQWRRYRLLKILWGEEGKDFRFGRKRAASSAGKRETAGRRRVQGGLRLEQFVAAAVDRELGTHHPQYPETTYPVNDGAVKGMMAPDGAGQGADVLGVDRPVQEFTEKVIAVIRQKDAIEKSGAPLPRLPCFQKRRSWKR